MHLIRPMENSTINAKTLGWILAIVIPFLIYLYVKQISHNFAFQQFLIIFSIAAIMWIFRLVHESIPPLFIISATMILGIVPADIALSGFISDAFFLTFSLFGLAAIIIKSGIFKRLSLKICLHAPKNTTWLQLFLFTSGIGLTPIVLAQINRLDILMPAYKETLKAAKLEEGSKAATGLMIAMYAGAIFFSEIVLTGKTSNIAIYSLLPDEVRFQFTWAYWLLAAAFTAVIMFILVVLLFRFFYKKQTILLDKEILATDLQKLGKMTELEWIAIFSVLIFIIAITISSVFKIGLSWLAFAILFSLMTYGALSVEIFRKDINWSFLFYIAGIIGMMHTLQYLHIDTWAFQGVAPIMNKFMGNPYSAIVCIFILVFLVCFVLGTIPTTVLLFPMLLPYVHSGIMSTWVLAFVILMASEAWWFTYQSTYHLYFDYMTEHEQFDKAAIIKFNRFYGMIRLIALLLSVSYWKYLGIL